jgi:hypothetical protein
MTMSTSLSLGLSNFCLSCGHGGHTAHLTQWFKSENECPTGCGCQCLKGKIHITLQWSGQCHLLHYSKVDIVIYYITVKWTMSSITLQ